VGNSFDHLVGGDQQRMRDGEIERLRGRQIDHEIEFGRLLDRDTCWLRPTQNLVDKISRASPQFWVVRSIGHQPSRFDRVPKSRHCRQSQGERQGVDANPVGDQDGVQTDIKCVRAARYEASGWSGFGSPKSTSTEVIDKLNKEVNAALDDPRMKARLAELGATALPGSSADFGKFIADETEKWAKVIKFAGIKPE
jgi:hypothetical protein